jgi:hypothetical protein
MAKLTALSFWFDDGTRYDIDPGAVRSIFTGQGAAGQCGHHGPYETPGPNSPVKGPFPDHQPPHSPAATPGETRTNLAAAGGSCYWVNGVIVCP